MDLGPDTCCMHEKEKGPEVSNEDSTWKSSIPSGEHFAMHRWGNQKCDCRQVLCSHLCLRIAQGMTGSHLDWVGGCGGVLHFSVQMAKVPDEWPWALCFLHRSIASMLYPGGP